jgi:hypothetical protein
MAKLTVNESTGDFTHVLTLSAEDIVSSSTNQTVWGQIPAGGAVDVAFAVESVALVGASDITLEVGTGTDDDTLIDSFDQTSCYYTCKGIFSTHKEVWSRDCAFKRIFKVLQ